MDKKLFFHLKQKLTTRKFEQMRDLKELKEKLERHSKVTLMMNELCVCEASTSFGSTELNRWMFVERYSVDDPSDSRPDITSLSCIIIPEMVENQNRHLPSKTPNPDGSVTMSSQLMQGSEIAELVLNSYSLNVRAGTFDDVLHEACAECGMDSMVICNHRWDYDNEGQYTSIYRVCLQCPREQAVTWSVTDVDTPHPFLAPTN